MRFLSGLGRLFLHHCGQFNAIEGRRDVAPEVGTVRERYADGGTDFCLDTLQNADRWSGLRERAPHGEQVRLGVAERADDCDGMNRFAGLIKRQEPALVAEQYD